MKKITSVLALSLALLAGCSNTSKVKESQTQAQGQEESKIVSVEFVGDGTVKKAEGKVSLYAISELIADAPATLIMEEKIEQSALPFTIKFNLPENHEKLIKPEVRDGEPIKYYVTIDWDSNGDGQAGVGDIVIDYDKKFPNVLIGEANQVFVHESK
ncbi:hypothetical protein [Sphingobacterium faecale]|uniref:Lipoprotein n=1 Tax=Sphingobacterium faecale TaxID=2803775 RepID=A0ABS1QY36_9SPHI|nr:hypothetical protein [Sphingobacterium faecale]MBL1407337.1 hypothetical protein [Sphingobacterium faecale]